MAKYRLQAPLDEDTEQALRAYAEATGMTMARAGAEVLRNTAPALRELAGAINEAKTAPAKAMRSVIDSIDRATAEIDQMKMDFEPKEVKRAKKA